MKKLAHELAIYIAKFNRMHDFFVKKKNKLQINNILQIKINMNDKVKSTAEYSPN